MTERRNAMAGLFAACWKDEALKARFMSDPKAVLPSLIHICRCRRDALVAAQSSTTP